MESSVVDFSARVPANALKRLEAGGFVPAEGLVGVEVSWVGLGGGKAAAHEQMVTKTSGPAISMPPVPRSS